MAEDQAWPGRTLPLQKQLIHPVFLVQSFRWSVGGGARLTTAIPVEGRILSLGGARGFGDFLCGIPSRLGRMREVVHAGQLVTAFWIADYVTNILCVILPIQTGMHYLIAVAVDCVDRAISNVRRHPHGGRVATILEISMLSPPIVRMCVIADQRSGITIRFADVADARHCRGFKVFGEGNEPCGLVALLGLRASLELWRKKWRIPSAAILSRLDRVADSCSSPHISADNVLALAAHSAIGRQYRRANHNRILFRWRALNRWGHWLGFWRWNCRR